MSSLTKVPRFQTLKPFVSKTSLIGPPIPRLATKPLISEPKKSACVITDDGVYAHQIMRALKDFGYECVRCITDNFHEIPDLEGFTHVFVDHEMWGNQGDSIVIDSDLKQDVFIGISLGHTQSYCMRFFTPQLHDSDTDMQKMLESIFSEQQ